MQNQNKYQLRKKITNKATISAKKFMNTSSTINRGIIDRDQYVQKVVTCSHEQQIQLKSTIIKRRESSIAPYNKNLFSRNPIEVQSYPNEDQVDMHIFSPFISYSLKKMLKIISKEGMKEIDRLRDILSIISKVIIKLMVSSNHQLYTLQTFRFEGDKVKDIEVFLNQASFAGMSLILNNEEIDKNTFDQIAELLQRRTLKEQPSKRLTLQLKFRALGMLLLSLWFGKPFHIELGQRNMCIQSFMARYQNILDRIPDTFLKMLGGQDGDKLKKIQDKYGLKFYTFLHSVFVKEKQITWMQVLQWFFPKLEQIQNALQVRFTRIAQKILEQCTFHPYFLIQELGLHYPRVYLLALLNQQDTNVDSMLKYSNLNRYLSTYKIFNPDNEAIRKRLLYVIGFASCLTLHQEPNGIIQSQTESTERTLYQKIIQILSTSYGIYESSTRQKKYRAVKQQTLTLKQYDNIFK